MLLIGLLNENTGVGNSEDNYSNVSHQRMDIISGSQSDTSEALTKLYCSMLKKGEESQKKLGKLNEELEFSDMSEKEYGKLHCKYMEDIRILRYDKVLIIDGIILK